MISNFHTHTELCRHASGRPADYIACAAKDGCSVLGFSDHCPYADRNWQGSRMDFEQAAGYMHSVREAAQCASFPVYAGFECEWHPRYKNWYKDFLLDELGADYLIYGSHWVEVDGNFEYIPEVSGKKELYAYTDLTIQGIASGLYAFLAHPDICMGGGRNWDSDTQSCLSAILDAAIAQNMPVEINGEGLRRPLIASEGEMRHPYPVKPFWIMAKERGAKIICNADAHRPEFVISSAVLSRNFAADMELNPIESIFDKRGKLIILS